MNRYLLAAIGTLALALPGTASAVTVSKSSGPVTAKLSYVKRDFNYSGVKLEITRAGQVVQQGAVKPPMREYPVAPNETSRGESLELRDLDGDGEVEVLLQLYSGGAHCCFGLLVYGFDPAANATVRAFNDFGNSGYDIEDLSRDGKLELSSADDTSAYSFTAYAGSAFPIQIYAYREKKLVDVTREFPTLVERDAARWLKAYRSRASTLREFPSVLRARLVAYLSDLYLLGRGTEAEAFLAAQAKTSTVKRRETGWPSGAAFVREAKKYLKSAGYLPAASG